MTVMFAATTHYPGGINTRYRRRQTFVKEVCGATWGGKRPVRF